MNRDLFKGMGGWEQLLFLCFLAFIGYIAAIMLISVTPLFITKDIPLVQLMQSAAFVRMSQAAVGICVFLIPSLAFVYLFDETPSRYLKGGKVDSTLVVMVVLLIAIVQPFVNAIGYLNELIRLPESLSSVEVWMKEKEMSAESIVNLCFQDKGIMNFVYNLLVIAVLAGVAEEFFFRGCMQRIIGKIVLNKHVAIWLTAFIFSAIHLQFYGFFPRLLLGAILGYLFIWSGSIWVPILTHILNNAIVVIFMQMDLNTPQYDIISKIGVEEYLGISILSLVVSCIILLGIYMKYKKRLSHL